MHLSGDGMKLNLAVKEWAGVIEALCHGSQMVFVRKYEPDQNAFLLYPTYSYYLNDQRRIERFNEKFQQKFQSLAKESALKQLENRDIVQIKAMFEIDEVIKIDSKQIAKLEPFMIWSVNHVHEYATKAKNGINLWVGRTKLLKEPVLAARQTTGGSITLYRHFEDVNTTGAEPVFSDNEYVEKKKLLLQAL